MRVTPSMVSRSLVATLARSASRLAKLQDQIATGRRLVAPSDSPGDTVRALGSRTRIARLDQLAQNADRSLASLATIESALGEVGGLISQAKEIALQSANAPVTTEDREAAAAQIDAMLERLLQIGNTFDGERYVFGGHETLDAPFALDDGRVAYRGDARQTLGRVDLNEEVPYLMPGSHALRVAPATLGGIEDLDPDIWEFTPLADLNGGDGVVLSAIEITDSSGASATVSLAGASTVKDVLDRINGAGIAVLASINAEGNGIALANVGGGTTITVAEVGDGIAASGLGILGASAGDLVGGDLDAVVSEATPLTLLRGGLGVSISGLRVTHEIGGALREGDVDLSFARSVGDLLNGLARAATPDGESLRIAGAIDASGTSLVVSATLPGTRLAISGLTGDPGAAALGVAGAASPRDLFAVLEELRDALRADDRGGIEEAIARLDDGLSQNLIARAEVGSRVARIEAVRESLEARRLQAQTNLSQIEDADLADVVVRANQEQVAYQAALSAASRTISVSLLDFLR
jgi:flagellin-like hook-associated protein FlgL